MITNEVQRLIKHRKKYLWEKLWKTSKSLGPPNKKNSQTNICIENKVSLSCDSLSIAETFKKYYFSLVESCAKSAETTK